MGKMKKKDQQILIPPIIGLIVAFFVSALLEVVLDKYYFTVDPDPRFNFSMYATIYTMLFIPLLIVAVVFQYFVVLKIWGRHVENKKTFNLSLWQLICISSLIFGLLIVGYESIKISIIEYLRLIFVRRTLFVLAYWFTNYFTMKRLGNPLDTKSVVKNV
jgi:hypothetical protein